MATGTEWMSEPMTITGGEYRALKFDSWRLNDYREKVRQLDAAIKDICDLPESIQFLVTELISKIRVDDEKSKESK